jgi:hypothetical protein
MNSSRRLLRLAMPPGDERLSGARERDPAEGLDENGRRNLLAEAGRLGVWPAAARNLGLAPHPRLRRIAARNLLLQREQARLLAALTEAGVRAHGVKGVSLAEQLYPDLSWREIEDLDLLVEPREAARAAQVLVASGLRSNHDWTSEGLERQLAMSPLLTPELTFTSPGGLPVELHWDWPGEALPVADLMEQPEHYLVYLCAHAGKHFWRLLKWTCDIELFVGRNAGALGWARFWELAGQSGAARPCAISLELCRRWFGGQAVPGLEERLTAAGRELVARAEAEVFDPASWRSHPVWTRVRLTPWSRRPAMLAAWLAPQPHDWNRAARLGWSRTRLVGERFRRLLTHWLPRSFGRLTFLEWLVLLEAYATVTAAEILRRVAPIRWLLPEHLADGAAPPGITPEKLQRLGWLVDAAANRQPWRVQCLARALALYWMLRRRGVRADLRIGVRCDNETVEAHAWLEWQGRVVHDPGGRSESYAALAGAVRR